MKKFLLILLTIIIVLAGGICGLYLNLESIVKASVAKYGSQLTGTEVALDGFRLSLRKGEAELKGLRIANPEGYQTPQILSLGSVYVRLDMRSFSCSTSSSTRAELRWIELINSISSFLMLIYFFSSEVCALRPARMAFMRCA